MKNPEENLHSEPAGSLHTKAVGLFAGRRADAETVFDRAFYQAWYADLASLKTTELLNHWKKYGIKENRFPNFSAVLTSNGVDPDEAERIDVDSDFYTNYYTDIRDARLRNPYEATLHFLLHGRKEGRLPNLESWMAANALNSDALPRDFSIKSIAEINAESGVVVTLKDILDLVSGRSTYPFRISHDAAINADYYLQLAKRHLSGNNVHAGRTLLRAGLSFEHRPEFLELLGNTYYQEGDHQSASYFYEGAVRAGGTGKWVLYNLANCKRQLSQPKEAVDTLIKGIEANPDFTQLHERLDECVREFWLKQQGALELFATSNDRQALIERATEACDFVYRAYLQSYGASEEPEHVTDCNLARVLIVGDYHIDQCTRYRISQKIEQLESAGKHVTAISWTDLGNEQNTLALHDVIIFYRVPAEPLVLKAIAQANATGKLSFYEIDDLLFDPAFPPPLESYGGALDLNTYISMVKGMALFRAAARHCRFGIASTQPLAEKLQSIVFGKRCFVHRNGLDSLNYFSPATKPAKTTVDIFYGSGTLAHNSDFNELALPAITRILDEYPNSRLVIAGHLHLPMPFVERYPDRVKRLPPVKGVRAYWSFLERADINIAVLHDDLVNGCKSELKWFEAACLGIPSVVSGTENYRDVIRHGEDGLIAATSEDWYQHLKSLVADPVLRQTVASCAQSRVKAEYGVETLSVNIAALLEQGLQYGRPIGHARRKKIALVNVYFPPQSIGGGTRVVADNFDVLRRDYKEKFDLCVFTSDAESRTPYQLTVYIHQGVRVYRSTILWRENMDWHPRDEKMGEMFEEFLKAEQPDLIHFHCVQRLTGSVVEAALKSEVPYIVTVHDAWWISDHQFLVDADGKVYPEGHPDPFEPRTLPANIGISESIERLDYLKRLLKGARQVLTVSDAFADIYRKNGIPQIVVNKNGISESVEWRAKETSHRERVVCAHVGGMAKHKGYFLLKEAVEALQPTNIEMLVVDHSKEQGYVERTRWGDVPVTFVGRVSQARVPELYRQIDVLFAPSTWPESYGLVTREAAACGCWVVATNLGGIGEDVVTGDSGFVVEPTLNSLAICLDEIDRNMLKYKGSACAQLPRSVAKQVTELSSIYMS